MSDKNTYIAVGHPLGYTVIDGSIVYMLDCGEICSITQQELLIWSSISYKEHELPECRELLEKKFILDLSKTEDQKYLMNCTAIRQGIGAVYENKHAINLGPIPVQVTESQLELWRAIDGYTTFGQLFGVLYENKTDFYNDVLTLARYDLIYLKIKQ